MHGRFHVTTSEIAVVTEGRASWEGYYANWVGIVIWSKNYCEYQDDLSSGAK
jgi:hypothetical protein